MPSTPEIDLSNAIVLDGHDVRVSSVSDGTDGRLLLYGRDGKRDYRGEILRYDDLLGVIADQRLWLDKSLGGETPPPTFTAFVQNLRLLLRNDPKLNPWLSNIEKVLRRIGFRPFRDVRKMN